MLLECSLEGQYPAACLLQLQGVLLDGWACAWCLGAQHICSACINRLALPRKVLEMMRLLPESLVYGQCSSYGQYLQFTNDLDLAASVVLLL